MKLLSRKTRRNARARSVRRTLPIRIETLEDRCIPAVTVTTPLDLGGATPGQLSLRQAIAMVNAGQVADNTIFRALAANRLEIWVGGAAGELFHSSDAGQHWTQVRPVANGEALADDIIGVEFADTLHGKVTTSVQEIWITADAGQTWQKQ